MKRFRFALLFATSLLSLLLAMPSLQAGDAATLSPPVAAARPHTVTSPNGDRVDVYFWLRDDSRTRPDVLGYLEAENAYAVARLAPIKPLEEAIYKEIVARIKPDESTAPYRDGDFYYYTRYDQGAEYPVYARKRGSLDAPEQMMLDANALGRGHSFYAVGDWAVSPNGQMLAYADDTLGRRQYAVRFMNLATGQALPDALTGASDSLVWAGDNRTLFYIENDPVTLLGVRVKRHLLGTDPRSDPIVYEEKDHSFYMELGRSLSGKYIMIMLDSTVSNEVRFLPAGEPGAEPRVLAPRQRDLEYSADHNMDSWVIRTNWKAKNFRIMRVRDDRVGDVALWEEVVPHREDTLIEDVVPLARYLAIEERSGGLLRIRIKPRDGSPDFHVAADESAYRATLGKNRIPDTEWLRYVYTSMATPRTEYDLNLKTGERKVVWREEVLGGYDPAAYVTERVFAPARGGAKIPVSLLYRKGLARDGTAPLYQYGYGSYGASSDPSFHSSIFSLVDRGFVCAVAHVRGGQEMGRSWYEDGRRLAKKNTFTDFIDVTEFLIREKYVARDKAFAMGGSAGGLLMGAITNMRPDLYRGVAAHVPFVDVVTTMLDDSIPLTANEFDEWGDPTKKEYYDYMLSYSPYDNVVAKDYPALFVTTGLWDSQVQYYEPAKWVAKLRAMKTDRNPLVFQVNMDAGHGGKSGRYQGNRDTAREYAFFLDLLRIRK